MVLYDCHSIRSVIPRLFPGELPVFNIGTNDGKSCDPALHAAVAADLRREPVVARRQRPLQGRLDHPHLRQAGRMASTRCRWSSRCAAILPDEERPARAGIHDFARPIQQTLRAVLEACLAFARDLKRIAMPTRLDNARIIRAPRGTEHSAPRAG